MRGWKILLTGVCTVWLVLATSMANATGFYGCTPGFWKNNIEKHGGSALVPTGVYAFDPLESVGFDGFTVQDGDTTAFFDALSAKRGGENALMRHAVAAYLNASSGSFPLSPADVVAAINAALGTGDGTIIEALKNELDEFNNLGCPLSQNGGVL